METTKIKKHRWRDILFFFFPLVYTIVCIICRHLYGPFLPLSASVLTICLFGFSFAAIAYCCIIKGLVPGSLSAMAPLIWSFFRPLYDIIRSGDTYFLSSSSASEHLSISLEKYFEESSFAEYIYNLLSIIILVILFSFLRFNLKVKEKEKTKTVLLFSVVIAFVTIITCLITFIPASVQITSILAHISINSLSAFAGGFIFYYLYFGITKIKIKKQRSFVVALPQKTISQTTTKKCQNCNNDLPVGHTFCTNCGARADNKETSFCPYCRQKIGERAAFCSSCGKKLII